MIVEHHNLNPKWC